MNDPQEEHIKWFQEKARLNALEAVRAKRRFRLISFIGILMLILFTGIIIWLHLWVALWVPLVFLIPIIVAWKDGNNFYNIWMKLRQDCLDVIIKARKEK